MARLRVSVDLIIQNMLGEAGASVRCHGVREVGRDGRVIVVEITGPDVPEAEEVQAIITRQPPLSVRFEQTR